MFHIHQLPGRLRVRSAILKDNETLASCARNIISTLAGVTSTSINTMTGSILIHYDTTRTHSGPILRELNHLKIIHGILAFPRLATRGVNLSNEAAAGQLHRLRIPTVRAVSKQPGINIGQSTPKPLLDTATKALLSEIFLTAGKILLVTLLEQSASSAAKAIMRKIL